MANLFKTIEELFKGQDSDPNIVSPSELQYAPISNSVTTQSHSQSGSKDGVFHVSGQQCSACGNLIRETLTFEK